MQDDKMPLRYEDARHRIGNGDLLLFRAHSLSSKIIQAVGRSAYSHAAMAVWCRQFDILFCCEVREFCGARAVTLSSQVDRFSGQIDVFGVVNESFNRDGAAGEMLRKTGAAYGYTAICCSALIHAPFLRFFFRPNFRDSNGGWLPEYCSAAVANAARIGGKVDPVHNLNDVWSEPGDLGRSLLWNYSFTLTK